MWLFRKSRRTNFYVVMHRYQLPYFCIKKSLSRMTPAFRKIKDDEKQWKMTAYKDDMVQTRRWGMSTCGARDRSAKLNWMWSVPKGYCNAPALTNVSCKLCPAWLETKRRLTSFLNNTFLLGVLNWTRKYSHALFAPVNNWKKHKITIKGTATFNICESRKFSCSLPLSDFMCFSQLSSMNLRLAFSCATLDFTFEEKFSKPLFILSIWSLYFGSVFASSGSSLTDLFPLASDAVENY